MIDDHGLEALRKSAELVTPGDKSNTYFKTRNLSGSMLSNVVYDYVSITYPTSTTETWVFKTGGAGGTTTATINLTYDTSGRLTTAVKT